MNALSIHQPWERASVPAGKIRQHVPGAPRQSGDRVLVVAVSDSTVDPGHIGKAGRVDYLNYDCGCGQRWPDEPMIGVVLDDGTEEEFWPEELANGYDAAKLEPLVGPS